MASPEMRGEAAADPDGKLTYVWQFGDGNGSVGSAPVHAYARSGLLRVQLTVTNEAGESTIASSTGRRH